MKSNTIYIRTLKRAEHTVFCVADGQKTYYDSLFGRSIPYSSGQQVKRSIIDSICDVLNEVPSPTTFLFDVTKQNELKEGEVYATCDPTYVDQLFGGWMKAAKGGKERTLKRRSPLSISAMRALHPLLAGVNKENASFDRSDRPNNEIIVRDQKGNVLTEDEVTTFLEGKDRSLSRKWIADLSRATGLFVIDVAIDLRRLFTVSLNNLEPEISEPTVEKLKEEGWQETKNVFGPCLLAPKKIREQWAEALASALINWKITSNQARTFSLMETLAISVSDNANAIAASIRAKLVDQEAKKAVPIVEEDMDDVKTFVTLQAGGYLFTQGESMNALSDAEEYIKREILSFDFENQL